MAVTIIRGIFVVLAGVFGTVFGKDVVQKKKAGQYEEEVDMKKAALTGFVTDFGDTLGIGSFAPTVAMFKLLRMNIHDRVIPGTLNVAHTIPVLLEAFIFVTAVEVETVTLVTMLGAAAIGSYVGAGIMSKLPEKKVQLIMGIALLITAVLMVLSHPWVNLMPGGGDAIGLTGIRLVIGIVGNFILGALMTAGIGLYAPCMALVYFLGMSPAVAFPIMMGSCAVLMPVASAKFIREDAYNKKASVGILFAGVAGVLVAYLFFRSLPIDWLRILVIVVILYTAITMLISSRKPEVQA